MGRRVLVLLAVAVVAAATLATPTSARQRPMEFSKGKRLYEVDSPFVRDRQGRAVFFHGVNAVWKRPPYYPPSSIYGAPRAKSYFDERDAAWLADNGFNSVRLGNLWVGVEPKNDRFDEHYLDHVEALVDVLARHGVTAMIDFHQDMYNERYEGEGFPDWATIDDGIPATNCCGFPGNYFTPAASRAFDNLYSNTDGLVDEFAQFWRHVAERFRGKANLIGYDLFNEPWPGNQWPTCANPQSCPVFDIEFLQPLFESALAAIREVDGDAIVWWEPNVTNDFGAANNVGALSPIADPADNQGISFHTYCLLGGQFIPGLSRGDDPECPIGEDLTFQRQHEAAARNGSALFLTEFGASDDLVDIARVADMADTYMVSWHYWHYGAWKDPTGHPAEQGLFENDLKRPETLKQEKADVLIRTYPQAVAGTPKSFSFDPFGDERRFELVYEADRKIDAPTVIFVPADRHYPDGYEVEVTGPARLTSSKGNRVVVTNTGGGEVTVVISRS